MRYILVLFMVYAACTGENDYESYAPCETDEGIEGECVPFYLCQDQMIITDGLSLIDTRNSDDECKSYSETCCVLSEISKTSPQISNRVGCGWSNPMGTGHTTQQFEGFSQLGEFPWTVLVLREDDNADPKSKARNGGGSLIHPRVVLTAAHTIAAGGELKVRAGEWDLTKKNNRHPRQERKVVGVLQHEKYKPGVHYNDVALLFLEREMELNDHIGVVCLPPKDAELSKDICFSTGWEKDKLNHHSGILRKAPLSMIARRRCQSALRKTRLGLNFQLHTSFVCAGNKAGQDPCTGDGGAPLVCPIPDKPGRYMQTGIVAWGVDCNKDLAPGVYVNVAKMREWIDKQLTYYQINMLPYQI